MIATHGNTLVRALWCTAAIAVVGSIGVSPHTGAAQTGYGCATCQANVQFYGHYPTKWRPWPGETRPDIHFPQSIGAEPVPRPVGEKPPVLPKERLEPVIPRPGQPFPSPPEEELLPGMGPAAESPSGQGAGALSPSPGSVPSAAPPAGQIPPVGSPFQVEPTPLPSTPAAPPGDSGGSTSPLPPSPPLPAPPGPPSSGIFPSGPELSARGVQDTSTNLISRTLNPDTAILVPTGGSPGKQPPLLPPSAPLVVVNPMVSSSGSVGVAQSPPPADKLALQRSEWLPDVAPGQGIPAVSQNAPVPSKYNSQLSPLTSSTPGIASLAASASSGSPGAAGVVWTEDTAPSSGVNPAGFVSGSAFPSSSSAPMTATATDQHLSDSVTPALGGFCPVELLENETWMKGDRRFAVEYQGRVYHCAGATQKRRFQTNPERYAPVLNGLDPVAYFDQGHSVEGKTEHCVVYDGRLYMFSSIQSLARFRQDPQRYARAALSAAH